VKEKMNQQNDRQICSPEKPMPVGASGRWAHTNVKETGTSSDDTYAYYKCSDCGHEWVAELPE